MTSAHNVDTERFPYDQIEAWIARQLPGWRWVDAVPSGMDTKTGALRCKVEGQVGPTEWERKYIWLFPDGSIQPASPPPALIDGSGTPDE